MNFPKNETRILAGILDKLTVENKIRLLNRARFCLNAEQSAKKSVQNQAGGKYHAEKQGKAGELL
jgi:hypothetical protein